MTRWINSVQTISYRLDPQRCLTLSATASHHWHLQVWGPEPFMTDFEDLTFDEARFHARSVVADYFKHTNPSVKVPSLLPWCAAVAVRTFMED